MKPVVAIAVAVLAVGRALAADYPGLEPPRDARSPQSISGAAETHYEVPYLDETRDTLTYGGWPEDFLAYRSRLHLWVPPGDGPFPCLIHVHGGGYGDGHSTRFGLWNGRAHRGKQVDPAALGLRKGYVLVTLNYILGGNGIHPQVQRDLKEAVRFLRANAEKYKIDPNRMAAVGSSAGGWLITSAGLTTADDFGYRSQPTHNIADLVGDPNAWEREYVRARSKQGATILFSSYDEAEPRHPQISSRLNALVFDLCNNLGAVSPDDPLMLSMAGSPQAWWARKGNMPNKDLLKRMLTLMDYGKHNAEALSSKGKLPGALHVPPHNLPVDNADGEGTVTAAERVYQFFDQTLRGFEARTPAAEARPNARFFAETVSVTFATAAPGTKVHYTLDASEPTTDSPVADKPIELAGTTTVKFIARAAGMQPSGVATATFIKAQPLPRVVEPDAATLPIATVGKPYEVQFKAPGAEHWHFQLGNPGNDRRKQIEKNQGHDALGKLINRNYNLYAIGLDSDPATGRLFGTPDHPGTYVLQVMTARDELGPAGCRTFTLVVLPSAKKE